MNAATTKAGGTPRRRGTKSGDANSGDQTGRSVARLAAVQALYQVDMTGLTSDDAIAEFQSHRLGLSGQGPDIDGDRLAPPDRALFTDIVAGAGRRRGEIDEMLGSVLVEGWVVARLEAILRALLRAGVFELLERSDVPARVIMSEYVDIAHAFFDAREAGMANGVLNRLARALRPREFGGEPEPAPGNSEPGNATPGSSS